MAFLVNREQLLEVDVGVLLCRGQARVSKELLDDAQIGAAAEEVRSEGMAERVGTDLAGHGGPADVLADHPLDGPRRQPAAAIIEKERLAAVPALGQRAPRPAIVFQGFAGLAAEGDDALFLALAADADEA